MWLLCPSPWYSVMGPSDAPWYALFPHRANGARSGGWWRIHILETREAFVTRISIMSWDFGFSSFLSNSKFQSCDFFLNIKSETYTEQGYNCIWVHGRAATGASSTNAKIQWEHFTTTCKSVHDTSWELPTRVPFIYHCFMIFQSRETYFKHGWHTHEQFSDKRKSLAEHSHVTAPLPPFV